MKIQKPTISKHKAKKIVRELGGAALDMTGCLHPNDMDNARATIRQDMRTLNAIIEGKIVVVGPFKLLGGRR